MKNFSNLGIFFKKSFFTYLPVFEFRKESATLNLFTFPGSKKSGLFSPKLALTDPYHPKSVALPLLNSWVFPQSSSGWILCWWDTVSVAIRLHYPCCWFYPQTVLEISIRRKQDQSQLGIVTVMLLRLHFGEKVLILHFCYGQSQIRELYLKRKRDFNMK